jgi:hypothetical protein
LDNEKRNLKVLLSRYYNTQFLRTHGDPKLCFTFMISRRVGGGLDLLWRTPMSLSFYIVKLTSIVREAVMLWFQVAWQDTLVHQDLMERSVDHS